MSYITKNGAVIAKIAAQLPSGTAVQFSSQRCEEAINASRECNLVNAKTGKISNGVSWDRKWAKLEGDDAASAQEINPGEFLIS